MNFIISCISSLSIHIGLYMLRSGEVVADSHGSIQVQRSSAGTRFTSLSELLPFI